MKRLANDLLMIGRSAQTGCDLLALSWAGARLQRLLGFISDRNDLNQAGMESAVVGEDGQVFEFGLSH